jgi:hypothetical protein
MLNPYVSVIGLILLDHCVSVICLIFFSYSLSISNTRSASVRGQLEIIQCAI